MSDRVIIMEATGLGYHGSDRNVCYVANLRFNFDGRIMLLQGRNGTGKTTIFRWLYQKGCAVFMPDNVEFPQHLTSSRILRLFGRQHSSRVLDELRDKLLIEDRVYSELSKGNRQKLAVLVFLTNAVVEDDRPFVLLDEPTAGLDRLSQAAFWEFLDCLAFEQRRRKKFIVVSHEYLPAPGSHETLTEKKDTWTLE